MRVPHSRMIFLTVDHIGPHLDLHCTALLSVIDLPLFNTRNSSGDEIANVNFLYDDIVHVLQIQ